ncbi:MAG: hypothetical protein HYZ50_13275 [Deltaproteobacteria bacterium]|nr:hypothetical protein [Deltaproteobacteria bacterium]
MKEYEALCLVEQWMHEYSPFRAQIVEMRPGDNDSWIVLIECSTDLSPPAMNAGTSRLRSETDERWH